jgi:hypothetical protein
MTKARTSLAIGSCAMLLSSGANAVETPLTPANQPDTDALAATDQPISPGLVTYEGHAIIPHGKCDYFHQKALETRSARWWHRYERCEKG